MPGTISKNGHVRNVDVMRLGDTTPKQFPIEYEYNGEERHYMAWDIRSRRYPSSVAAELDDARNDFIAAQKRVNPDGLPVNPILLAAVRNLLTECGSEDLKAIVADGRMQALLDEVKSAVDEVDNSSVRTSQRAWERYLTRCMQCVVSGIDYDEADVLGPDRMRILVRAGLFPESMLPAEDDADDQDADTGTGSASNPPQAQPQSPPATTTGAKPEPGSATATT